MPCKVSQRSCASGSWGLLGQQVSEYGRLCHVLRAPSRAAATPHTVHDAYALPYARDRGVDLASAALALTAYGVGAAGGRLASGPLSDRLGAQPIMRACFALQVIALVVLAFWPPLAVLLPMVALFGLGFTGADTVYVRAIPDVFGLKALGAITGVLTLGWRAGAALGPAFAGFIHDATGSYALPFGLAPVAVVVGYVLFVAGSKKS